jgi:hypothetical protein
VETTTITTGTTTTITTTSTTNTIFQNLQGRMTEVEVYMEAQIQALIARVANIEVENAALQAMHATPDAAASDDNEEDGVAGNAAQVAVDPITHTLMVSAAAGATVRVAPVLKLGKYDDVENTLVRHATKNVEMVEQAAALQVQLALLKEVVAALTGQQ